MINIERSSGFVTRIWTQRRQAQAFTQAMQAVYPRWAARNRQWANAFFDEHFLLNRAMPLLEQVRLGNTGAAESMLANQWADQFRFSAVRRQQLVAEATPVAANLLYLLKLEIAAQEKRERAGGWAGRLGNWTSRQNDDKPYDN